MFAEAFKPPPISMIAMSQQQQDDYNSYLENPYSKPPASSLLVSHHSPYYPHSQMRIRSKSQLKSNGEKTQSDFNNANGRLPSSVLIMQAANEGSQQGDPHHTYSSLFLEGSQVQRSSSKKKKKHTAAQESLNIRFIQKRMTVTVNEISSIPQIVHMNQLMMPPTTTDHIKRKANASHRQILTQKHLMMNSSSMNADLPPPPTRLLQQPSPLLNQRIKQSSHQVSQPPSGEVTVVDQRQSELGHLEDKQYMNELFNKFRKTQDLKSPTRKTFKAVAGVTLPILQLEHKHDVNIKSTKILPILPQRRTPEKVSPKPTFIREAKSVVKNLGRMTPPRKSSVDDQPISEKKIEIIDYRKLYKPDPELPSKRKLRESSNPLDYDPDNLSARLVKNKINHLQYKPELFKPFTIRQIQKIINDSGSKPQQQSTLQLSPIKSTHDSQQSPSNKRQLPETNTNVVDRIIEQQLLPRKEQIELERQRRHDESIRQEAGRKLNMTQTLCRLPKQQFFDDLNNDIQEKELHQGGKVLERTNSRKVRVRAVMQQQFERQYGTRQAVMQAPEIFVAQDSQPEVDYQRLVRKVLSGQYDFDQEQYLLNKFQMGYMKKSEKYNLASLQKAYESRKERFHTVTQKIVSSNKREFRRGNAKFVTCSTPDVNKKPLSTAKMLKNLKQKRLQKQLDQQVSQLQTNRLEQDNSKMIISDHLNQSSIIGGQSTTINDISQILNNTSQPNIDITDYFGKINNDSQIFELSTVENKLNETQGSVTLETERILDTIPLKKIRFINNNVVSPKTFETRHQSSLEMMRYRSQKYYDLLQEQLTSQTYQFKHNIQRIIKKTKQKIPVDPEIYNEFEQIQDDKEQLGLGISEFLECDKMIRQQLAIDQGNTLSVRRVQKMEQDEAIPNIIEYVRELEHSKQITNENFQNEDAIKAMQQDKYDCSIAVNQLGKTKIWKPNSNNIFSGRKAKQIFKFLH